MLKKNVLLHIIFLKFYETIPVCVFLHSQILHMLRPLSRLVPRPVRGHTANRGRQHRRVHLPKLPGQLVGQFRQHEGAHAERFRGTQEAHKATPGKN